MSENKSLQVARTMWPDTKWETIEGHLEARKATVWTDSVDGVPDTFCIFLYQDQRDMARWLAKQIVPVIRDARWCGLDKLGVALDIRERMLEALASDDVGEALADLVIEWGGE